MADDRPWWHVAYTLDGEPEQYRVRAVTSTQAVWYAALELADRGFSGRVELVSVAARVAQ